MSRPPSPVAHAEELARNGHDNPSSPPTHQIETDTNPAAETGQTPASDGRYVRHTEQESDTKKRSARTSELPDWSHLTEVSAFYPQPESAQQATLIAFEFGKMLRISQDILASAAQQLGLWELLKLEDRMARQAGSILNPDAYLRSVLRA